MKTKEEKLATLKTWLIRNPDYNKRYYNENRERISKLGKEKRRNETPEQRALRIAKRRPYDKDKKREYDLNRRANETPEEKKSRLISGSLRRRGLTREQYDEMNEKQGGLCSLCQRKDQYPGRNLCIDHDHATGKVRQLLCTHCNSGLGMFQDSPELLRAAAAYIETHK